jgi:hypothetical protein
LSALSLLFWSITRYTDSQFLTNSYNSKTNSNVNPIQLGFLLGFSIKIGKSEKLFLNPEVNYQINLYTKTKVSANNPIGNILVNNIINPTLKKGSEESFGTFKLPSLSLKLVYRFSN